jgi:hypothetical protein
MYVSQFNSECGWVKTAETAVSPQKNGTEKGFLNETDTNQPPQILLFKQESKEESEIIATPKYFYNVDKSHLVTMGKT